MTSKTSLSKINAVLRKNFRQNKPGFIISSVVLIGLVVFACRSLITFKNIINPRDNIALYDNTSTYIHDITNSMISFLGLCVLFICCLTTFVASVKMFKEIYSKRASDMFFSLPVKREEYFVANALYGTIYILCSVAVVLLSTFILGKTNFIFDSKSVDFDFGKFTGYIFAYGAVALFVFSISMLCTVLCGKKWQTVGLTCLTLGSFPVLVNSVIGILNSIYGFNVSFAVDALHNLITYTSYAVVYVCISRVALALVVFAIGYAVFKHRKAETAQENLDGKVVSNLFLLMFQIIGAVALSLLGNEMWMKILFIVIAVAVITLVYCGAFYRKPCTKQALAGALTSVVLTSLFVVCVAYVPAACGYKNYVPKAENIKSAQFISQDDNYMYSNGYSNGVINTVLNGFYYDEFNSDNHTVEISDKETLEKLVAFHSKTVSDEAYKRFDDSFNKNIEDENDLSSWYSYSIKYLLDNGKTVTRCYTVNTEVVLAEYSALMKESEILKQEEPFCIDNSDILFARVENVYSEDEVPSTEEYDEENDSYYTYYDDSSYYKLNDYSGFFESVMADKQAEDDRLFVTEYGYGFYIDNLYYDNDYSIVIYSFTDDATSEIREKISKMTPKQLERFIADCNENYPYTQYVKTSWVNVYGDNYKTKSFLRNNNIIVK